jgi:hypothetical protein
MKGQAKKHKTFEVLPHSARQAEVSANYHGKVIDQMNPNDAMANAKRFPQTGLGG